MCRLAWLAALVAVVATGCHWDLDAVPRESADAGRDGGIAVRPDAGPPDCGMCDPRADTCATTRPGSQCYWSNTPDGFVCASTGSIAAPLACTAANTCADRSLSC